MTQRCTDPASILPACRCRVTRQPGYLFGFWTSVRKKGTGTETGATECTAYVLPYGKLNDRFAAKRFPWRLFSGLGRRLGFGRNHCFHGQPAGALRWMVVQQFKSDDTHGRILHQDYFVGRLLADVFLGGVIQPDREGMPCRIMNYFDLVHTGSPTLM